ncbi:LAME_0F03686g1_1 [Lachancea meyersii CBS 8951]|uniref:LAME_0F03686g1_1 n=1 Tax=Lachancea meyersii CBS 8951 TaxID=1266667 RepID=A0A1G4JRU4_9SACH|nr:LAME_0F03686g1_1 [Lachancea meyersii CBS 8951]
MQDPFLALSPFKNSENLLVRHSLEIAVSFFLYLFVVERRLAPAINRRVFGTHYTKCTDRSTRINFDIHTVSMVQCVVSLSLTAPILRQPLAASVSTFQDPFNSMVAALTCGYFLWDVCVCVKHFSQFGVGFLGHALASLYVFVIALRPFCQSWVGKFLIFEASTPFVNVNWYFSQLAAGGKVPLWLNALNGVMLILTFFCVRIVWGFSAIAILIRQLWLERELLPVWLPLTVLLLNTALNCLNLVWLNKMIRIAKKMAKRNRKQG